MATLYITLLLGAEIILIGLLYAIMYRNYANQPARVRLWLSGVFVGNLLWVALNFTMRYVPEREVARSLLRLATVSAVIFHYSLIRFNWFFITIEKRRSRKRETVDILFLADVIYILLTDDIDVYKKEGLWFDDIGVKTYIVVLLFTFCAGYWFIRGIQTSNSFLGNLGSLRGRTSVLRILQGLIFVFLTALMLVVIVTSRLDEVIDTTIFYFLTLLFLTYFTYIYGLQTMSTIIANQKLYQIAVLSRAGIPIYLRVHKPHVDDNFLLAAGTKILLLNSEHILGMNPNNTTMIFDTKVVLSATAGDLSIVVVTDRHNIQGEILLKIMKEEIMDLADQGEEAFEQIGRLLDMKSLQLLGEVGEVIN